MTQPANPGMFSAALAEQERQRGYGQFTGYAPIPGTPGAYNFQTANGQNVPFVGAPAEQLRGQIDAARGAPQQATTFASGNDGSRIAVKAGGDPSNVADYIKETPGSRGRKAGMVAQGMTSQGGYELDPEMMRRIDASQDEIQGGYDQAAFTARKAMAERQAYITAMREQASKEAVEMARENTVKQQGVDELRAKYEAAEQDFLATPDRQKKDREGRPVRTVVEGIASALGALGASMARTPNFAAQMIEANRERELRQEEAELRVKKDAKDSMLGRLRDEMGSMSLARDAFRALRTRQDAMALEQVAAKTQDATRAQEILQMAGQQNQAYLKYREALERGQQGEIGRTFRYDPGSSGSGPRRQALTLDEHAKVKGLLQADANLEKTRAEAARGGAEGRQAPHERTNAISGMAAAIGAANRIESNITGRGMGNDTTLDDPLTGGADAIREAASSVIGGSTKKSNDALRADSFEMARGLQLAYGKSDNDARMADEQAAGSATGADRLRAARSTKQRAINNIKAELSTMPPEQQQKLLSSMEPDVVDAIMDRERK